VYCHSSSKDWLIVRRPAKIEIVFEELHSRAAKNPGAKKTAPESIGGRH
jgi:hypothetical protein